MPRLLTQTKDDSIMSQTEWETIKALRLSDVGVFEAPQVPRNVRCLALRTVEGSRHFLATREDLTRLVELCQTLLASLDDSDSPDP